MESKQQLSQQQDASVSPEPSAPRQSKMKFVVMGFIVLLLLVGVGAYILGMQKNVTQNAQVSVTPTVTLPTPTPDPMAGWKTYNDSQNSFTFRYPSGWFTGKSGDGTILLNDEKITETIVEPNQVTATLEVINDKQLISLYPKNPPENSERKVINDITFDYLKIVNTGGQPPKQPIVAQTVKNDTLYTFALSDLSQKTTFDQILSTFTFIDAEEPATSSSDTSVRTIAYKKTAGLVDYASNTGYSIQIPTGYHSIAGEPEKMSGNACAVSFTNDVGGITTATIVPYNGGSRRVLLPEEASYTYRYEDVVLQGIKSLIQQKGSTGESGSGTNVVIPVGKYALIVGMANRGKDDNQLVSLLQSIKFNNPLDVSKCGK